MAGYVKSRAMKAARAALVALDENVGQPIRRTVASVAGDGNGSWRNAAEDIQRRHDSVESQTAGGRAKGGDTYKSRR